MVRRIEPSCPDRSGRLPGWLLLAIVGSAVVLCTGCNLGRRRVSWKPPTLAEPVCLANSGRAFHTPAASRGFRHTVGFAPSDSQSTGSTAGNAVAYALAEQRYAAACARQTLGSADSVDLYYQAALHSWCYLQESMAACHDDARRARVWQVYHSSLARLIETGQRYGRLDPAGRLLVNTASGPEVIPVAYPGFVWRPEDFGQLVLVGDYQVAALSHSYRSQGIGVPLVVRRRGHDQQRFHSDQQQFAATAVLRFPQPDDRNGASVAAPTFGPSGQAIAAETPVFELYDPLRVSTLRMGGRQFPLRADRTAPFALLLSAHKRQYFEQFVRPDRTSSKAQLIMVEPYQPGKIPLVFIHGLLSDPLAWLELANEIRARDDLMARYQLWAFMYPTGEPFLHSAASLRRELQAAVATYDPHHQDPALSEMVLVGHSMGGLISRLQVSSSSNTLWKSVANRPLDQIVATREQRASLRESFFFEPVPYVRRVVFLGTPHGGSAWANRLVGRLGSSLVRPSAEHRRNHDDLVCGNPNVFARDMRRRVPTSIDMLEPDNSILLAMQHLRIHPAVRLHSIMGTGKPKLLEGPGDGVVSVTSARQVPAESEVFVSTDHGGIHDHPDTVRELMRILSEHALEGGQPGVCQDRS